MDVQDGLPPCHGPKLHPSALTNASITWKDMLDDYSEPYSGHSEIMAHDFKVEIESKHYALKVFMPYDISYDYHQFYTAGIRCTEEELEWHVMPFYSECRAYGRIKQAQDRRLLPHQVAVPCHGYIRLEEKDIRKLEDEWNLDFSVEQDNALKTPNRPIYAIVEDLASAGSGVSVKSLPRNLRDLRSLHSMGIFVRDIKEDNYRDGKLVDFGTAWTEPHVILNRYDSCQGKGLNG
ncbi:kinetochore sim4 complex subunit FTA2 domain-containing protein [Hirsutella rhossiliensis]|uniref:Kinetochore sim4 complex subunit FTA2 domain-containing protein n=1 Tax=Hirsutella rhossiliensis TaxID=111463 RepID=A0A9P8MYG8_9HYPO|nr:kinetochore sim4 complex subunit FTA2 domain-containing protein [Hirsutella rhossiliensis]KAH0962606.1 kinetochore sim4 complex subunit FTA2 domain-containing protein [Hirsutella rhossiliensis]